ncbi:MAG: hypothetical protein Q9222_003939 [Ikaeria aurantiellina]
MASDSPPKEPKYGSRLLPQVLDALAISDADRIYASVPKSTDLADGFRNLTMLQMATAVNHLAWWLDLQLGKSSTFETISYLGPPDIRYAIIFLAAVKCGYKVLFPSPRNTTQINNSLLDQTHCSKFLASPEVFPIVDKLQEERKGLQICPVPSLDEMLVDKSKHYPYDKDYASAKWDPMVVLHSSGSTGKPSDLEGGTREIDLPQEYRSPLHSPSNKPSTGQTAAEIMRQFKLRALFCPPNIYEQLLQESDALDLAKSLDFVMYAGGPLTNMTGTALSKVTDVCGFYGSTEAGPAQALVPPREDWDTLEWHPLYGADMQPSDDDAYELVLHRNPKLEGVRGLSCNFPDVETWHTKDLFKPHATKKSLWRFHGRTDDIIVLSNGEKFNPVPSEAVINSHSSVSAALIVGQGQFQPALLIELAKGDSASEFSLDDLWPTIEKANAQAQGHGRIIKTMVAVADPSKAFERAGKGTVVRKLTAEKFSEEIANLYSTHDLKNLQGGPKLGDPSSMASTQEFVRSAVAFSFPVEKLKDGHDLYVHGLDSLKTVEITAVLRAGLQGLDSSWLTSQSLYANPTIKRIASLIHTRLGYGSNGFTSKAESEGTNDQRVKNMAALVKQYGSFVRPKTTDRIPSESKQVILTGSTGSLGKKILADLLASHHVTKVYCLDRSADARSKHSDTPGLENDDRVEFLKTDFAVSDFGVGGQKYKELLRDVDTIIHCAWKVDFNHSLESFGPIHLQSIKDFIHWQMECSRYNRIFFISSTSSVSRWPAVSHKNEPIPEEFIEDHGAAQEMGYGESKNVAEHTLHEAWKQIGVSSTILRVGQIAGPLTSNGVWNPNEWVPALIKTSAYHGYWPSGIPDVDWIPVDSLSRIITEISLASRRSHEIEPSTSFLNIVNPHLTPWTTMLDTFKEHFGADIKIIPLSEWVESLAKMDSTDPKVIEQCPALKILDFFRALDTQQKLGQVRYSTEKAQSASPTMASLPPIGPDAMKTWLKQWGY